VEQGSFALTTNPIGGDAPLLDQPADLAVPGNWGTATEPGNLQSSLRSQSEGAGISQEMQVPMVEFRRRGLDAQTREQYKAEILREMRDRGMIQPPVTPIPKRPATTFEQGSLVDELMTDPDGQLSFDVATGIVPVYKASGKNGDAWIEEVRLRFEYNLLDSEALKAQREAYLAERGWAGMTWEEKKRSGLLSKGFYSLQPKSKERVDVPEGMLEAGPWRQPPEFNPELNVAGDRAPAPYRRGPDGVGANPAVSGDTVDGLNAQIKAVQASTKAIKAKGGGRSKEAKVKLQENAALLADLQGRLADVQRSAGPRAPRPYSKTGSSVPSATTAGADRVIVSNASVTQIAADAYARRMKLNDEGDLIPADTPAVQAPAAAKAPAAEQPAPSGGKQAPADQPIPNTRVAMGKAENSTINQRNLARHAQDVQRRLEQKKRQANNKGGC